MKKWAERIKDALLASLVDRVINGIMGLLALSGITAPAILKEFSYADLWGGLKPLWWFWLVLGLLTGIRLARLALRLKFSRVELLLSENGFVAGTVRFPQREVVTVHACYCRLCGSRLTSCEDTKKQKWIWGCGRCGWDELLDFDPLIEANLTEWIAENGMRGIDVLAEGFKPEVAPRSLKSSRGSFRY